MGIESSKAMRQATKRLLVACGMFLALQIPGGVSGVYRLSEDSTFDEAGDPDNVLGFCSCCCPASWN